MHIEKIKVKNFRLLEDVELSLEEERKVTVIVGRNNSGKTSLTELFRRLLAKDSSSSDPKPRLRLEDFSFGCHQKFIDAYNQYQNGAEAEEIRKLLPCIEMDLLVNYADSKSSYGPLSEFIIDLNPDCTKTWIRVCYEIESGKIDAFFSGIELEDSEGGKNSFFKSIKERVPKFYATKVYAEEPSKPENHRDVDAGQLRTLLKSRFINAQRGLDDAIGKDSANRKKNNILASILENLFRATMESANEDEQDIIEKLQSSIRKIQTELDGNFKDELEKIISVLSKFGYPRLNDPNLKVETDLDIEKILEHNTKVRYEGINDINLPEVYNGLGVRNLIYILLQLLEFHRSFTTKASSARMNLIFIEEPEAHLHPQMQEVFIKQLEKIAENFSRGENGDALWPVQFVVTTHSSHIANKAPFEAIRYFLTKPIEEDPKLRTSKVKDLKDSFLEASKEERNFIHRYMELTACDLFFADKIILIEGPSERILLPKIIEKVEDEFEDIDLTSQYLSVLEVGGCHAHKFFNLLRFLDIKTLIITDIDSVGEDSKACLVAAGKRTSNKCIKEFFNKKDISPCDLLAMDEKAKVKYFIIRIAYQIPEDGSPDTDKCGRSFEDAFVLANFDHKDFQMQSADAKVAHEKAEKLGKKTDFAIKTAIEIEEDKEGEEEKERKEWEFPRYIKEGLLWLAKDLEPQDKITEDEGSE